MIARLVSAGLPTGLEFGRFSIDYHYLRNALYCDATMGGKRAARHVPEYARAIMARYEGEMRKLEREAQAAKEGSSSSGAELFDLGGRLQAAREELSERAAARQAALQADFQAWLERWRTED